MTEVKDRDVEDTPTEIVEPGRKDTTDSGTDASPENKLVYQHHLDPQRALPGGIYLDDVQRELAEIQRAKVEDREPDLENPPAVQGTPVIPIAALNVEQLGAAIHNDLVSSDEFKEARQAAQAKAAEAYEEYVAAPKAEGEGAEDRGKPELKGFDTPSYVEDVNEAVVVGHQHDEVEDVNPNAGEDDKDKKSGVFDFTKSKND